MYALVVFVEDNVHYVCPVNNIRKNWKKLKVVPVQWTDGYCYPAKVICTHESIAFLKRLERSISGGLTCDLNNLTSSVPNELTDITTNFSTDEFPVNVEETHKVHVTTENFNIEVDTSTTVLNGVVSSFGEDFIEAAGASYIECATNKTLENSNIDRFHEKFVKESTFDKIAGNFTVTSAIDINESAKCFEDVFIADTVAPYNESAIDNTQVTNNIESCAGNVFEEHSTGYEDFMDVDVNKNDTASAVQHNLSSKSSSNDSDSSLKDPDYTVIDDVESSSSEEAETEHQAQNCTTKEVVNIRNMITLPVTERAIAYERFPRFDIPKATGRKTRRYFCIFCKNLFANLPQHLEHTHRKENAVENFVKLPPGSKDRKRIIEAIRRQGDFEHNTHREYNTGTLMVSRRSKLTSSRNVSIVTCPECKGQFYSCWFYKHFKKCSAIHQKNKRDALTASKAVYQHLHPKACYNLIHRVFPVLREDECVTVMRYDELAVCVMNDMCRTYADQHFDDMIRAKIRLMGRLMLKTKELDKTVTDLASLMDPTKYDLVIQAINEVAGLNPEGTHYRAPSVATTLSTLCKRAANIWKIECLKKKDLEKKQNAEDFLALLTVYNTGALTRTAIENRVEHQRQKIITLPDKEDIAKLVGFVRRKRREAYKELSNYVDSTAFPYNAWKSLSTFTLLSLLIFNRRRPGELERIKLRDYASLQGIQNVENLTTEQIRAARTYKRFQIRGKLNRSVPVLVHWEVELSINLIIKYRGNANVPEANPYIFGLPSNDNRHQYMRACVILRDISSKCGAVKPELLRVTVLRKQIATECAILDLSDNVIKDVANFMGHAEKIHNDIYRLPVETRDIAQMSTILEIVQGGNVSDESDENTDVEEYQPDVASTSNTSIEKKPKRKHGTGHKRFCGSKKVWTFEERNEVSKVFENHFSNFTLPSYEEVENVRATNVILQARSPQSIRAWIENKILDRKLPKADSSVARRIRWSDSEKKCLYDAFSTHINGDTLPSQNEIKLAIRKFPELENRPIKTIKTAVLNEKNRIRRTRRIRWSDSEKKCLYDAFSTHINGDTLPSQNEIKLAIRKFPELENRPIKTIKTAVLNEKNRIRRSVNF
ncbi:hypothetical protein FQR65_LT15956 [Abscondita terminalis]|nr:hypothetical protein FQR65_LT15956 [Abscondita terminalis]